MDYIEMALNEQYAIDSLYNKILEESLEAEAEFILSALESGMIPVYEAGKMKELWNRFVEAIRRIFGSFTKNFDKLLERDEEFIAKELDSFKDYSFKNLSSSVLPYIPVNKYPPTINVVNMCKLQNRPTPAELENLKTDEDIMQYKSFKDFYIKDRNYKESSKIKFIAGSSATDMPALVEYKGNELYNIVQNTMIPFIRAAKNSYNNIKNDVNQYEKHLKDIEKKGTSVMQAEESFSLLENTLFKYTDLRYCINSHVLFEADEQQSTSTPNNTTPKANKVVDNTPESEKQEQKEQENEYKDYDAYFKKAASLALSVLAARMTVFQQTYAAYMSVLKDIHKLRGVTKTDNENKVVTKRTTDDTTDKKNKATMSERIARKAGEIRKSYDDARKKK